MEIRNSSNLTLIAVAGLFAATAILAMASVAEANGDVVLKPLEAPGQGDAYVCADDAGRLFRKSTPCDGSGTFTAIVPCREFSSFDAPGTPLTANSLPGRQITVGGGICGIPADATAISFNVTIVNPGAPGFLTLYPVGATLPVVSSLNFETGDVTGNAGIVALNADSPTDDLNIYLATSPAGETSHVILDVTGYFN